MKEARELGVGEVADLLGDNGRLPLAEEDFQAGIEPHDLIGRQQFALGQMGGGGGAGRGLLEH